MNLLQKIVSEITQIYKGKKKFLELGNINSRRDWGYAKKLC